METNMRVNVLDHGYIEPIEHWGSDERIVEAARMSTGKGFLGWDPGPCEACDGTGKAKVEVFRAHANVLRYENAFLGASHVLSDEADGACMSCDGKGAVRGDAKLLAYLYQNWHHTPFEMAGLIIDVQAPIMVFREWHRHRTQSYNEMSARYVPLPDLNYIPTVDRCLMVGGANKQAGTGVGASVLTHDAALKWLGRLAAVYDVAEEVYKDGIAIGVPKELARLPVPVARYSRMRASTCLRNWLAFMTLRSEAVPRGMKAQWELRQCANVGGRFLSELFPRTWELFVEGKAA